MKNNKKILYITAMVIVGFIFGGGYEAQAASCAGVTPGNVTVTDGSGAYYVVYGVTGAQYVIVRVGYPDDSQVEYYNATHLSGGDWGVSINHAGYGTFNVGFWPNWQYCASATFTRTTPPPPPQYYSCYGGGSCHPDDNSGTFPNDPTCGGNQACYVAPPPPTTGTIIVNTNNQDAAYYITRPNGVRFGEKETKTFTNQSPTGNYSIAPDAVPGFDLSVSPGTTQTLNSGSSITWNISYTAIPTVTATMTCPSSPISYNSSANVSWSSANASSCTGAPAGGTGPSGSFNTGNLTSSQTYSVTCNR